MWHVLGTSSNIQSVNAFGERLQKQLIHVIDFSRRGHGGFINSCEHHCMSCSHGSDELWTRMHRVTTSYTLGQFQNTSDLSIQNAFGDWFQFANPIDQKFLHIEDYSYFCDACCKCRHK